MAKRKRIMDRRTAERKAQDRIIYSLGFNDAEIKYKKILEKQKIETQRLMECMKITNKRLFDEIRGLDVNKPIDFITISMDDARDIMSCLRGGIKNYNQVKKIRKKIKEQEDIIRKMAQEFEQDLRRGDKEKPIF